MQYIVHIELHFDLDIKLFYVKKYTAYIIALWIRAECWMRKFIFRHIGSFLQSANGCLVKY